jgi:hypothetical protein
MHVSITRAPDGNPAIYGPHRDAPTTPRNGGIPAFTVPLFPPTRAGHTQTRPRVVALTSDMAHPLAHAAPVPDAVVPAALLLVASACRLLIAIGPFHTTAAARAWRGGHDPDLARAGIAYVVLGLSTRTLPRHENGHARIPTPRRQMRTAKPGRHTGYGPTDGSHGRSYRLSRGS